jgi:hypothetical protein
MIALLDPLAWPIDVPSAGLGSGVVALMTAGALWLRSGARKAQAEGDAIAAVVERCRSLEARVAALESALDAERSLRVRVEAERDLERTGRHEALGREREAVARLEAVERDAERRLAEALVAVERSAQERGQWERMARAQADAYAELVRAASSAHSASAPPDRLDELDTLPPPR